MEQRNLLIIGLPGSGKTTLIMKLADKLKELKVVGFYTAEIRVGGARKGFEIVDLRGERALSHTSIYGEVREETNTALM